jgi:aspartyl-tRNA(Asn)/glutamyl-tRNA(Gln) amidotransferase subunit A
MRFARNPWDLSRSPGGSSSGAGAALAAGFILGGIGTDTGGSIRGPASSSGITGLKPTYGRVSKEGCVPLSYSLDHIGPMARTARDCALMLQVMAGQDPRDACTTAEPVPNFASGLTGSLEGVTIGIPHAYFFEQPELAAEVRQAVCAAIDQMAAAGAVVRDVVVPRAPLARTVQRVIMLGEAYAYHQVDLQHRLDLYGKNTRSQILQGSLYSAADYVDAQRVRSRIKEDARAAMVDVDVLVTPTSLSVASAFEGYDPDAFRRLPSMMSIWNVTGQPALSVCCGFSTEGLPIGMQIVGKPFNESMVLRVGDAYQHLTDWHTRTPSVREVQPA